MFDIADPQMNMYIQSVKVQVVVYRLPSTRDSNIHARLPNKPRVLDMPLLRRINKIHLPSNQLSSTKTGI